MDLVLHGRLFPVVSQVNVRVAVWVKYLQGVGYVPEDFVSRVFGREWFDESLGVLVSVVAEADGDVRVFFQKEVCFPTVWAGL